MASNNRTPESVLNAPDLPTPGRVSDQSGRSRAERRHVKYRPKGKTFLIPKAARAAASNEPYSKTPAT